MDNHDKMDNSYAGLTLGRVQAPAAASGSSASANDAILAYLGQPAPAPAGLDEKFSPQSLLAAFISLCAKENYAIKKLAVDDTEFPFLVYGRVGGKRVDRE